MCITGGEVNGREGACNAALGVSHVVILSIASHSGQKLSMLVFVQLRRTVVICFPTSVVCQLRRTVVNSFLMLVFAQLRRTVVKSVPMLVFAQVCLRRTVVNSFLMLVSAQPRRTGGQKLKLGF